MTNYRILPEALVELRKASIWYEEQRIGLGLELMEEFKICLESALLRLTSGSPIGITARGHTIRRFRLRRFKKYSLLIALMNGIPTVIAFQHASRYPGYWHHRVK